MSLKKITSIAMLSTSKLNFQSFYFLNIYYLVLVFIFINFNSLYHALDGENNIIELTGAFALLLAGIVLFKTGLSQSKKNYKFYTYIFVALAFAWAAGEEISWGQHLLGLETPDWLIEINDQNETNLHNINKKFFDRTLERLVVLLTLITSGMHLFKRESLLGFKLPEYPLTMAFMLLLIYRRIESIYDHDVWYLSYLFFLVYPIIGLINRNRKMLFCCAVFIFTSFIVVHFHMNNIQLFGKNFNIYHEMRETAFAILCVFYAIQLAKSEKIKRI